MDLRPPRQGSLHTKWGNLHTKWTQKPKFVCETCTHVPQKAIGEPKRRKRGLKWGLCMVLCAFWSIYTQNGTFSTQNGPKCPNLCAKRALKCPKCLFVGQKGAKVALGGLLEAKLTISRQFIRENSHLEAFCVGRRPFVNKFAGKTPK